MIEALEPRIAPAAVISFTEVDGDRVFVKTSLGTKAALDFAFKGFDNHSTGVTNITLDFADATSGPIFAGTSISITVKQRGGGNGLADDVIIDGFDSDDTTNIDFRNINVQGNLEFIDAGDENLTTKAIKNLKVSAYGDKTSGSSATSSQIRGDIGAIFVKGDFNGYIYSSALDGSENFQSTDGTVIGSFSAKNIALFNGDNCGHLQVSNIGNLTVRRTFFGSSNGSIDNGLIEADSIDNIAIKRMAVNASIVLS